MRKTKKKKSVRIVRYARVSRRSVRRLTRKKVITWLDNNLKGHPFVSGILFLLWISKTFDVFFSGKSPAKSAMMMIGADVAVLVFWLLLVVFLNLLKDKQNVRWFFKKKFVFVILAFLYPFGLIFLWSGSKFKHVTKMVLTVIFGLIFLGNVLYQEKVKTAEHKSSAFERITKVINAPKKKVFLPAYAAVDSLRSLRLKRQEQKQRVKLSISEIHARYSPSVVSIKTKDKMGRELGLGSGFVITEDGFIATNYHVVESAYEAEVKVAEKTYSPAYLVKATAQKDIAILKIDVQGLIPLSIGDSEKLVSGQSVVALGSPLGLEKSVSSGIVSSVRSGREIKLIQMTVPVSPGSSGGPVFDEYGDVIGITTLASFLFAQNVNFAVPIDYLDGIIKQK